MTEIHITWFHDSPDVGQDCLCSLCLNPITEDDICIRMWTGNGTLEARFHGDCWGQVDQESGGIIP